MTHRSPYPPQQPMVACPNCGSKNEPSRTSCRNCHKPMSGCLAQGRGLTANRICRTPADAFTAGWEDGADDPPLTSEQRTRLAALLAPFVHIIQEAA